MAMACYTFQELTLEVTHAEPAYAHDVAQLLQELSWVGGTPTGQSPTLRFAVHQHTRALGVPAQARCVFRAEGFCGAELEDAFYLTDGASLLHLQPMQGQGTAHLAPTFRALPRVVQDHFWAFGLLKLLRPLGFYSLHAAGVVPAHGQGILIIGASGSGKSTLALGLLRQGWGYLSDDAVLLREQPHGITALACRKHWYVDARTAARYADLPYGDEEPETHGGWKRRILLADAYPEQQVTACLPRMLLFPRLVPSAPSAIRPLDRLSALQSLLAQSGPQLFDRRTMTAHLEVLKRLVQQAACYALHAGCDLYEQPGLLGHLLAQATGEAQWLAS
jgi:hypothetical protein